MNDTVTEGSEEVTTEVATTAEHAEHVPDTTSTPTSGLNPVIKDRLVLPILVPLGAAVLVLAAAIAISRVFLAGASIDVAIAALLTVGVLVVMASLSAARKMTGTGNRLWIGVGLVAVLIAGLATMSYSHGEGEAEAFVEPEGEPVATVDVTAVTAAAPLQISTGEVPAGIIEMNGSNLAGHVLEFKNVPELSGFALTPEAASGKVELAAGTYTFWCKIPGHQAMVAELTVE